MAQNRATLSKMNRRLTRQEQKEQTRARLIETADQMYAQEGVFGTSLRGLCDRAGYTQGAFYSNFDNKHELSIEVLQQHIRQEVALLRSLVDQTPSDDLDTALMKLTHGLEAVAKDPLWSLLSVELQLHARRDAGFATRWQQAKEESYREFATLIEMILARHNLRATLPTDTLAVGLYTLWSGLALQGPESIGMPREQVFISFFRGCLLQESAPLH